MLRISGRFHILCVDVPDAAMDGTIVLAVIRELDALVKTLPN